jgi:triacylglycerol lipase
VKKKIIQDVGEEPLVLHSDAQQPLKDKTFLQRALVMAELAMISYNDEAEAQRAAAAIGFSETQLFDNDGSQAYRFRNEHDCVIAYRGTEPTEWNDIRADAKASLAVLGSIGKVHSGFNGEVDDVWPLMEDMLRDNTQPAWFCGHSLGAAMATICAYRCKQSAISTNPEELHTFGSPRVGNKQYLGHATLQHYRWVHNNDIVTRVPPVWMGYRHGGDEIYLDMHGRIRRLTGLQRSRDRWRGFVQGLLKWNIDLLTDHSVHLYVKHIVSAVEQEERAMQRGREAVDEVDLVVRHENEDMAA